MPSSNSLVACASMASIQIYLGWRTNDGEAEGPSEAQRREAPEPRGERCGQGVPFPLWRFGGICEILRAILLISVLFGVDCVYCSWGGEKIYSRPSIFIEAGERPLPRDQRLWTYDRATSAKWIWMTETWNYCWLMLLLARWRAWPVADDRRPVPVLVRRLYRWRLPWEPRTAPPYTTGCPHCRCSAMPLPVTTVRRTSRPSRPCCVAVVRTLQYTVFLTYSYKSLPVSKIMTQSIVF